MQLGEMTLKRHHMQLLESAVARHEDFVSVFGEPLTGVGRHRCAEVKRSSKRRWLRLLGTRQDLQYGRRTIGHRLSQSRLCSGRACIVGAGHPRSDQGEHPSSTGPEPVLTLTAVSSSR